MPYPRTFTPGGLASPTLNFSEDLSRFPSESLHSFSFAHQSEDVLHNRQNVLRRSIDFMHDRIGWMSNHPGLVSAQAKVSGDAEVQSMVELLARANLLGNDIDSSRHLNGPLTGPAYTDGLNVFEKQFLPRSESPEQVREQQRTGPTISTRQGSFSRVDSSPALQHDDSGLVQLGPETSSSDVSIPNFSQIGTARNGLKRTYTDTFSLSIHDQLIEALARPYAARNDSSENQLLMPTPIPHFGKPINANASIPSVVHGHAQRWAPAAQAIFTTESQAPWTILAANDLACLVFGVTKAEVRKLGILEVVGEDRRGWLQEKLNSPGSEAAVKARNPAIRSRRGSPNTSTSSIAHGGGITAQLLRKPPARQMANRRAQTESSFVQNKEARGGLNHPGHQSRGVLLCGDVLPILKRNGAEGSASVWVKEKRSGLIWVLEEIVEDISYLNLDDSIHVLNATGPEGAIWGIESVSKGTRVRQLLPQLPTIGSGPKETIDCEKIEKLQHFAARNLEGISIPVSITVRADMRELRVSSFPHIAGILVLSANTLEITSSNPVFSAALFGIPKPEGLPITKLIPQFEKILHVLTEEDNVRLIDGIVIPEHSFRKARALLALRERNADVAAIFLRPTGLVAIHRDGSEINVDVQMRVVKSESVTPDEVVLEEPSEDENEEFGLAPTSEVVYALWITYSRQLHSAVRAGGPASPLISRPGSPPHQPSPGQTNLLITPEALETEDDKAAMSPASLITQQIHEATSQPIAQNLQQSSTENKPAKTLSTVKGLPNKKTISDFCILEDMGQGAYGQVKLARYRKNNTKVVLKYVTKKRILVDTWTRDRRLGTVPLEIHVLDYLRKDGLRHPNIVEMTDFFEDDINYYIEMIPHGLPGMDLFDYIEMRSTMEEDECRNIFLQVVAALHHLHTKALVVHRDIKDENIILDGEHKVKLIDFGSAAYIKNGPFDVFVGTIGKYSAYLLRVLSISSH